MIIGNAIGISFHRGRLTHNIVAYTATGAITDLDPATIEFRTDHFRVPSGTTSFSFKDDGTEKGIYYIGDIPDAGWQSTTDENGNYVFYLSQYAAKHGMSAGNVEYNSSGTYEVVSAGLNGSFTSTLFVQISHAVLDAHSGKAEGTSDADDFMAYLGDYAITMPWRAAYETLTYHVSNAGDNNNDGLSDAQAWEYYHRGIPLAPGSIMQLKNGYLWHPTGTATRLQTYSSGRLALPLTFTNYDEGELPIISGRRSLDWTTAGDWTETATDSNIWYADGKLDTSGYPTGVSFRGRLWMNTGAGLEEKMRAEGHGGDNVTAARPWAYNTDRRLFVYATSNPTDYYTDIVGIRYVFLGQFEDVEHIILRNIEFQGGDCNISGSSDALVEHCKLGMYATTNGMSLRGTEQYGFAYDYIVRDNIIDSGWEVDKPNDFYWTQVREGVQIASVVNIEVYRNTVKNWGHGGIQVYGTASTRVNPTVNAKIYDNFITCPDLKYGRGLEFAWLADGQNTGNECYNNYIYDTRTQNQFTCEALKFYCNIIDTVRGSDRGDGSLISGKGISLEDYNGVPQKNKIYHSIIADTLEAGIRTRNSNGSVIEDNEVVNNIFYNCGTDGTKYALEIRTDTRDGANIYRNNCFFVPGDVEDPGVIWYGKMNEGHEVLTVVEWQNDIHLDAQFRSDAERDIIEGNFYADPQFVDIDNQDYRLRSDSPLLLAENYGYNVGIANGMESTYLNNYIGEGYDGKAFDNPTTPTIGPLEYSEVTWVNVNYTEQTTVTNIQPDTVTYDTTHFVVPVKVTEFSFDDDGETWVFRYEDGEWNLYEHVEYP